MALKNFISIFNSAEDSECYYIFSYFLSFFKLILENLFIFFLLNMKKKKQLKCNMSGCYSKKLYSWQLNYTLRNKMIENEKKCYEKYIKLLYMFM